MNSQNNTLNVLFSADDNYAQHLGAAIYSLLENNKSFQRIQIFVVDNNIKSENKKRLLNLIGDFSCAQISFIDFSKWKEKLCLNMQWQISISTYARLFISEIVPEKIDRILYLDCDMIICDSLFMLWNIDLKGKVLAAVQDTIGDAVKASVGVLPSQPYFNAGMLLIDLKEWRRQKIGEKSISFIEDKDGSVTHHDQGVLNGILKNNWLKLPLQYNLMTIHFVLDLRQISKYFQDNCAFYLENEIKTAKTNPVIIHYTPSFTTRPWMNNCKHPQKELYWEALSNTAWKGVNPEKDDSKLYVKLINWRYRNLPY